ncbi:MAG TPA: glutamine--fructose-6-phosphate transaminase (isomerizing) [Candidatus Limiplasma sp.]|nr:glutamine--fructose-6-phosphate transaminase (isomerizing) [Candidatus Limiplasma sp.]HPS80959.1 glutamine--fructose-6-phosphate transaminase (isomerizing) [Candidatus Limiplasma sp.]
MCGIVGYVGSQEACPILMEGLSRLSYRGYDSAGVAILDQAHKINIHKAKGRLENLESILNTSPLSGMVGIGHTRWATHGEPSDLNAHPHTDVKGGIAVVHNGIIENHETLRRYLKSQGCLFVSQTDTEVIAHLLSVLYEGDMKAALLKAMGMMEGSYALGVLCDAEPDRLFCARHESPLVVGAKDGEAFIASDIPAMLGHTRDVIFLQDKEIAVLSTTGIQVFDQFGGLRQHELYHVEWDLSSAEKGGYAHYMLKEIHEQPTALQNTFTPRNGSDPHAYPWLPITVDEAKRMKKISVVACGTAYHAGVFGKYVIEKISRIPVIADIASEYRYRDPIIGEDELFIAVSQSGETADTLAALREAKRRGAKVIAICNVVGSTIAREVGEECTLYTYAGPEIAVASTKAYMTQVEMMLLIAVALGDMRGTIAPTEAERLKAEIAALPAKAEKALLTEEKLQWFASTASLKKHVFFVGRGLDFALSLEAALKLKEVSYVFSEAYAAGELKHGPIALLQDGRLVVAIITQPALLDKTLSNLREIKARGAHILAVCREDLYEKTVGEVDELIQIPAADDLLTPLLAVIPLQLFAYCMAVARGCDVDKPRNLAKSVTVE